MGRPVVWILDAHYQIFRAYYSLPDLRAPDGTPVGALRGYAAVLLKSLARQKPTHLAAAFDFALTSFRNQLYPDYKFGRTEAPEDLEPQFELCEAATRALGIRSYSLEGFEADDVIATLVPALLAQGADVRIVSADKDLGALVSERVSLFDLKTERASGPDEIRERLGVAPELVPDYLTLVGDSADNIPGVRGIGPKTACLLLDAYGGLDRIPRDAAELAHAGVRGAARVAERLAHGGEEIELSRRLVRMRSDLPVETDLEALRYRGADRAELGALLERLGAQKLLERVPRFRE